MTKRKFSLFFLCKNGVEFIDFMPTSEIDGALPGEFPYPEGERLDQKARRPVSLEGPRPRYSKHAKANRESLGYARIDKPAKGEPIEWLLDEPMTTRLPDRAIIRCDCGYSWVLRVGDKVECERCRVDTESDPILYDSRHPALTRMSNSEPER